MLSYPAPMQDISRGAEDFRMSDMNEGRPAVAVREGMRVADRLRARVRAAGYAPTISARDEGAIVSTRIGMIPNHACAVSSVVSSR